MLIFSPFWGERFFQTLLKNFLCAAHEWSNYLEGAFDFVVYDSEKIRTIRHTNRNILKQTWAQSGFWKSTSKIKELNGWECSFLALFEVKDFFQTPLKNFLCTAHEWSSYLEGVFDLVVYDREKIRTIRQTNPKIFNKTASGWKNHGFFFPLFPI